jgi:hypothetical protein
MSRTDEFSRAGVRGSIEEACGQGLSVDDPLPDTLIAQAQALGLSPIELRLWIYEPCHEGGEWSADSLARWARSQRGEA